MNLKSIFKRRSKRKAAKAKLAQAFKGNTLSKRTMIAMAQTEGILPYPDKAPFMSDDKLMANVVRFTKNRDGSLTTQERSSRLLLKVRRLDRVQCQKYLQSIS